MPLTVVPLLGLTIGLGLLLTFLVRRRRALESKLGLPEAPTSAVAPLVVRGADPSSLPPVGTVFESWTPMTARSDSADVELGEPGAELLATAPPVVDRHAHAYAELSRSLARAGRLREATLAQWAADLRVLGPLLVGRHDELSEALAGLSPADAHMAIAGARAVASSLVGPSIAVTAMLADASHLSAHETYGRSPQDSPDVSPEVLPDPLLDALGAVLLDSAAQGSDTAQVSVGLRCDLVAHVANAPELASASPAEVTSTVRDLLEPHERSRFDAAVVGTRWAS